MSVLNFDEKSVIIRIKGVLKYEKRSKVFNSLNKGEHFTVRWYLNFLSSIFTKLF